MVVHPNWGAVSEDQTNLGLWDLVLVAASVISVVLFVLHHASGDAEFMATVRQWDFLLCFLFLYDWGRRLVRAKQRVRFFFGWGLIDLLGSLPMIDWLRWMRMVRVYRVLRSIRSPRNLWIYMMRNSGESSLAVLSVLCISMLVISSLLILRFEGGNPAANITTGEDAFWWAIVTITTVGYGDFYPVTHEGRLMALLLMLCGIGCFSTFAGYLASVSLGAMTHEKEQSLLHQRINDLEEKLDRVLNQVDHGTSRSDNTAPESGNEPPAADRD